MASWATLTPDRMTAWYVTRARAPISVLRERHVVDVLDGVGVRVDVDVVGDRGVVADDDLAAVVDEDVAVDRDPVAHRQVVAERELDIVEDADALRRTSGTRAARA